jgi:hypothetical protein
MRQTLGLPVAGVLMGQFTALAGLPLWTRAEKSAAVPRVVQ